jgi:hypothetical protein
MSPGPQRPKSRLRVPAFLVRQGTAFETAYTLTGTEPIKVSVTARKASGAEVKGFSIDNGRPHGERSKHLAAGSYSVTVTAENSAGESSAEFFSRGDGRRAGDISANDYPPGHIFSVKEGSAFQTTYTLKGTRAHRSRGKGRRP